MCEICKHKDRADIENAILSISSDTGMTIEKIAEFYKVDLSALRNHALFHTPLVVSLGFTEGAAEQPEAVEEKASLARRMKLREADILATVSNEYLVTLKAMGRRINKLATVSDIDIEDADKEVKLAKMLTKPMVDLYISLGGEIRQNVKAMAEVDRMLNGPQDNGSGGLLALAEAIKGSGSQ